MQHVPTLNEPGHQHRNRRFALFTIALLILIAAALLATTVTPQLFAPTAVTSETYANPELWAYERYSFTALPGVAGSELAVNPELMVFRQWQTQATGTVASDFEHANPEVGFFNRWQATR